MNYKNMENEFKRGIEPKLAMDIGYSGKILEICTTIIKADLEFYVNPNGGYEHLCPFCGNHIDTEKAYSTLARIEKIKHDSNCLWLKAKNLYDEINKENK